MGRFILLPAYPELRLHSVCNADGELMFDVEDIEAIKQLPSRPVIKVFNRSNEINGITPEQVDTAEKNS